MRFAVHDSLSARAAGRSRTTLSRYQQDQGSPGLVSGHLPRRGAEDNNPILQRVRGIAGLAVPALQGFRRDYVLRWSVVICGLVAVAIALLRLPPKLFVIAPLLVASGL